MICVRESRDARVSVPHSGRSSAELSRLVRIAHFIRTIIDPKADARERWGGGTQDWRHATISPSRRTCRTMASISARAFRPAMLALLVFDGLL